MNKFIKEFSEIKGQYVDEIPGQARFGYALSDMDDFFEIEDIIKYDGSYKGSVIRFYDYLTGKVYLPFDLKKNIAYGRPIFIGNIFYILQVDFNEGLANIYKYYPGEILEKIIDYKIKDLSTYNLELIGSDLHLISQDSGKLRNLLSLQENNKTYWKRIGTFDRRWQGIYQSLDRRRLGRRRG